MNYFKPLIKGSKEFHLGKLLITVGIFLIISGVLYLNIDKVPWLKQIGHLPGDIELKGDQYKLYFPLGTSILVSVLLSFGIWIVRKIF